MKQIFTRFLPALATVFAIIDSALIIADPHGMNNHFVQILLSEVGGITLGYALVLTTIESIRMRRDGTGRRHALAGLAAPFALGALSPFVQAIDRSEIFLLSIAAGVVTGLVFWVGWNRREAAKTPSLDELEQKADAELALLDPTWRHGAGSIGSSPRSDERDRIRG